MYTVSRHLDLATSGLGRRCTMFSSRAPTREASSCLQGPQLISRKLRTALGLRKEAYLGHLFQSQMASDVTALEMTPVKAR